MRPKYRNLAAMLRSPSQTFLPSSGDSSPGDCEPKAVKFMLTVDDCDEAPTPQPPCFLPSYSSAATSSPPSPNPMYAQPVLSESKISANHSNHNDSDSEAYEEPDHTPRSPIKHKPGKRYYAHALTEAERESLRRGGGVKKWTNADLLLKGNRSQDLKEQWMIDEDLERERERQFFEQREREHQQARMSRSSSPSRPASIEVRKARPPRRANRPLSLLSLSSIAATLPATNQRRPSPLWETTSPEEPRAVLGRTFDDFLLPVPTSDEPDAYALAKAGDEFDNEEMLKGRVLDGTAEMKEGASRPLDLEKGK
ncbi:uncharacterized protein BDZ99DRAFT_546061 [Mytilinidion resinicola]|uniref:Uncharacterized protein n=1 Tax=Mytilinidion resinicola TaxID=574789 RepID=A0A6A6Y6E0_9PEZI|nr:uncharacterized protein BDZ99DRAFT_546061 [Mytilinidion resinicola]KAF2804098.1 hypothetical protein BDZ99DRAFT_546061 [Mytilinidion resinicola]